MLKPMYRLLTILFVAVVFTACQSKKTDETQDSNNIITERAKARIDSTLNAMVDSGRIVGVSALIVEKDKEVYFNSFGHSDLEKDKHFDRNTIVRIFSMTKPVTGVALMQLYEKGLFQLDDPLSKYAPEFANMKVMTGVDKAGKPILEPAKRQITVRDITRHTAGFASGEHAMIG